MTALDGVNGTVCNAQQYQQSLQSYDSSSPSISCLTPGQSIGLAFQAEASVLSCICVVVILIWMGVRPASIHIFILFDEMYHSGTYIGIGRRSQTFSLFAFDILQGIGGTLSIRWAHNGIVTTGPFCTVQGIIEQIGELGVALITLFLAVHTFVAAVLQVGLNARGVALSLVCLTCVFITLWVAIGAGIHKDYATPTPYWCWISPQFPGERLGGEYVWMWIALLASATLYIPLYYWAEGFWSVDEKGGQHWECFSRWLQFSHHHVSSAATFFASSVFHLSGAVNVLLFLTIRPGLLLFPRPRLLDYPEQEIELARRENTGRANFSDTAEFQHSPEPTLVIREGEGTRDSATPPLIGSRRISNDIDI
ncbi:hypothetical protein BGY98DRAFT_1097988 [Russula aff. rugulosa BPL654]|nr:hypothetical protein BGY98DRAFT_1097988 [Russula aff. rugulosa BPL654]